jgi:hypothetical protein
MSSRSQRTPVPMTEFEDLAYSHLKKIFGAVQRHQTVRIGNSLGLEIDMFTRSGNGRPIFFVLKYSPPGTKLPQSGYLSVAALRDYLEEVAASEAPVLAVLTSTEADPMIQSLFAKSRIPVAAIGSDVHESRLRLWKSFQEQSIYLPELDPGAGSDLEFRGRCFISIPDSHKGNVVYHKVIEPVVRELGLTPVRWVRSLSEQYGKEQVAKTVGTARISIVDISVSHPSSLFDAGIIAGLGRPIVLICEASELPSTLYGFHVLRYDFGDYSLTRFKDVLLERLVRVLRDDNAWHG